MVKDMATLKAKEGSDRGPCITIIICSSDGIPFKNIKVYELSESNSVTRVNEALENFSATTGLVANIDKSSIFLAGMEDQEKEQLIRLTQGVFPIRYLGLPEVEQDGMSRRLHVIVAVLFSIHSFWRSVFILPQRVVKEVDKKCREYLWGTTRDRKKVALIAWDKICVPKKYGGLNIKGCGNWNVASVGKLIWQLALKEDSL
ncbi:uncharacterized protein [Solanum tuberosum]|uniref:uncharacterized protein n=1 Tax=Solanum tuberosum TaxID=4113 RepID=UPI00073A0C2A|nr:PREDICTED: uncharacterized protein LOC107061411 [Solanum tuberosum]